MKAGEPGAFMTGSRIIMGHMEIESKTNEIPGAELIMTSGFRDMIFTFDAVHCQEKTLEAVKETGNDAIVQVKKNQKQLFNDCIRTSESLGISDS